MIRWHDSSCRRPAVSVASGIPCCNYCFAIAIVEQETIVTDSSVPLNKSSHSSPWPLCLISGSPTIPKRSTQHGESEFRADSQESLFPTLPSEDHIRLVRLDAGHIDGLLHVDLEVVHIYNQPAQSFEILSYTSANESEGSDSSHIVFVASTGTLFTCHTTVNRRFAFVGTRILTDSYGWTYYALIRQILKKKSANLLEKRTLPEGI